MKSFREAVSRYGAATPRQVVMLVRLRYLHALAAATDARAAEHYGHVIRTLIEYQIDVRQWAAQVIKDEKKRP